MLTAHAAISPVKHPRTDVVAASPPPCPSRRAGCEYPHAAARGGSVLRGGALRQLSSRLATGWQEGAAAARSAEALATGVFAGPGHARASPAPRGSGIALQRPPRCAMRLQGFGGVDGLSCAGVDVEFVPTCRRERDDDLNVAVAAADLSPPPFPRSLARSLAFSLSVTTFFSPCVPPRRPALPPHVAAPQNPGPVREFGECIISKPQRPANADRVAACPGSLVSGAGAALGISYRHFQDTAAGLLK